MSRISPSYQKRLPPSWLQAYIEMDIIAGVKPMPMIGKGVEEIRIWEESGTYRVIFTARLPEAVYVLHAFTKKTRTTSQRDIGVAKERFRQLMRGRK
jgi:phage-related protein